MPWTSGRQCRSRWHASCRSPRPHSRPGCAPPPTISSKRPLVLAGNSGFSGGNSGSKRRFPCHFAAPKLFEKRERVACHCPARPQEETKMFRPLVDLAWS